MAIARNAKADLAWEVMSAAVELIAARHEDGALPATLQNTEWSDIAEQLAVWLKRLPTEDWHCDLPEVA